MDIKGKITEIFEIQNVKDNFKKREFVIEYAENPQYPEFIKLELIQDKCELLNNFKVGQEVTTFFNLKGRKWVDPQGNTKYFNSLQAWKIQLLESENDSIDHSTSSPLDQISEPEWLNDDDKDNEDLPF